MRDAVAAVMQTPVLGLHSARDLYRVCALRPYGLMRVHVDQLLEQREHLSCVERASCPSIPETVSAASADVIGDVAIQILTSTTVDRIAVLAYQRCQDGTLRRAAR